MEQATITAINHGLLEVKMPYNPEAIAQIKRLIKFKKWYALNKTWIFDQKDMKIVEMVLHDNNIKTQVQFGVKNLGENRLGIALPLDDRLSYTIKMIKSTLREEFGAEFCPLYKLWIVSADHYDKIVNMVRSMSEFNKNSYTITLLPSMYDLDNNAKIYIAKHKIQLECRYIAELIAEIKAFKFKQYDSKSKGWIFNANALEELKDLLRKYNLSITEIHQNESQSE